MVMIGWELKWSRNPQSRHLPLCSWCLFLRPSLTFASHSQQLLMFLLITPFFWLPPSTGLASLLTSLGLFFRLACMRGRGHHPVLCTLFFAFSTIPSRSLRVGKCRGACGLLRLTALQNCLCAAFLQHNLLHVDPEVSPIVYNGVYLQEGVPRIPVLLPLFITRITISNQVRKAPRDYVCVWGQRIPSSKPPPFSHTCLQLNRQSKVISLFQLILNCTEHGMSNWKTIIYGFLTATSHSKQPASADLATASGPLVPLI